MVGIQSQMASRRLGRIDRAIERRRVTRRSFAIFCWYKNVTKNLCVDARVEMRDVVRRLTVAYLFHFI